MFIYEMDTWFSLGQKDIGVSFFGIEKDSEYFADAYVDHDIVVSSALANKLNLKPGDTLLLTDKSTDKEHSFTIDHVYPYDASMTIFIDHASLAELLDMDKDVYNCIYPMRNSLDDSIVSRVISDRICLVQQTK